MTSTFLDRVAPLVHYGLVEALTENPEAAANAPNQAVRQVKSGHYVSVPPTPLPAPRYVAHSSDFLRTAFDGAVDDATAQSEQFVRFFSGDLDGAVKLAESPDASTIVRRNGWATGYALSIMGQEYYDQCPFRNGNGYGDGRAISILEVSTKNSGPWEFQLKGAGPTPYCRGADGRAVLRSSIREFVVSEAMHGLGVATTRGLSLIVSGEETVKRAWYSESSRRAQPDVLVDESCAIATRCAPSFIRVGQIELFARRARKREHPNALKELADITHHAIGREYPELGLPVPSPLAAESVANGNDAKVTVAFLERVIAFVDAFKDRLTTLVADWVRVGFCQGNFNADNCAVGGRTLDYGPFGFCEVFDPDFQPWSGGGKHYAFFGQPSAAMANFSMLCSSMMPLAAACEDAEKVATFKTALEEAVSGFAGAMTNAIHRVFAAKLGLREFAPGLFSDLMSVLAEAPMDYTIFFRELCEDGVADDAAKVVSAAFYAEVASAESGPDAMNDVTKALAAWLPKWHETLAEQHGGGGKDDGWRSGVAEQMRRANPRYIPREWMLREAYRAAIDAGNYSRVHELLRVFRRPYERGEASDDAAFYRRAPTEMLSRGGVAVMT